MIIERLWHHAALVQDRPEFIASSGVVVADADGRLAGIATDDDQLHAFAEVVGQGAHEASLLCLFDIFIFV